MNYIYFGMSNKTDSLDYAMSPVRIQHKTSAFKWKKIYFTKLFYLFYKKKKQYYVQRGFFYENGKLNGQFPRIYTIQYTKKGYKSAISTVQIVIECVQVKFY